MKLKTKIIRNFQENIKLMLVDVYKEFFKFFFHLHHPHWMNQQKTAHIDEYNIH